MGFPQWLGIAIDGEGWNLSEAGRAFGVSHTTVRRWLDGSPPRYEHLESIANALRLDLEVVLAEARRQPYATYSDLDETKSRLRNLVNEVRWTEERELTARRMLEGFIELDKKGKSQ